MGWERPSVSSGQLENLPTRNHHWVRLILSHQSDLKAGINPGELPESHGSSLHPDSPPRKRPFSRIRLSERVGTLPPEAWKDYELLFLILFQEGQEAKRLSAGMFLAPSCQKMVLSCFWLLQLCRKFWVQKLQTCFMHSSQAWEWKAKYLLLSGLIHIKPSYEKKGLQGFQQHRESEEVNE